MEKRSRRRTRDLVAQAASQGLSENEIGCARISMMARSKNAPFKGRIQKRKTLSLRCSFRLATHGRSIQDTEAQDPISPLPISASNARPLHPGAALAAIARGTFDHRISASLTGISERATE